MKNKTCNTCPTRDKCKELCPSMQKILKNYKNKNDIYADTTINNCDRSVENIDLSRILYSNGLSDIEYRDVKRIVLAILTKEQKEILELYTKGHTQIEISKIFKVSQSCISQRIDAIKNELRKSIIEIIPYIIEQ